MPAKFLEVAETKPIHILSGILVDLRNLRSNFCDLFVMSAIERYTSTARKTV